MTYEEFKQKFLPEFLNIKSFAGKMKFANQYLQRIGSGSGRVVFDIDGQKVLKLAKNAKGIAQNEQEENIGRYDDYSDIITKIFEASDNNEWLIVEKAKKVNETRIKQLTGIPSLLNLFFYLKNFELENKGRRGNFGIELEIKNLLDNNEFVNRLENLMIDYGINLGDLKRPSSYGEVIHDGQPTIVLTDYGLSDEVFDTYYNPNRQQKYQMYELYNFADGNDDMLGDLPPQDAIDTRHDWWGLMPYSVDDGHGVINEEFISFVKNRDKYPDKPISTKNR